MFSNLLLNNKLPVSTKQHIIPINQRSTETCKTSIIYQAFYRRVRKEKSRIPTEVFICQRIGTHVSVMKLHLVPKECATEVNRYKMRKISNPSKEISHLVGKCHKHQGNSTTQ